jgi:hypothetical protein
MSIGVGAPAGVDDVDGLAKSPISSLRSTTTSLLGIYD